METPFEDLTFAYQLHYHYGFRTRYRKPLFTQVEVRETLQALLEEVCHERRYHLLECRAEPIFVRALVSLRPEHAPSDVAQYVKGVLSRRVKPCHPEAFPDGGIWSGAYFCRSVGKARRSVVEGYVASQWEHHGYTAEALRRMRYRFEDEAADGPTDLCYHIALEVQRRVCLFSPEVTDGLVAHLREALAAGGCVLRGATFLPDHAHFSARAPAKLAPADLAKTLLTEGWRWVTEHQVGALKLDEVWDVWSPSAYTGTIGDVTTAHISSYLKNPD